MHIFPCIDLDYPYLHRLPYPLKKQYGALPAETGRPPILD